MGGRTVAGALGIRTDGTKVPPGLAEDQTESEEMVPGMLADLVSRGLDVSGVLWIVDGGPQLRSAIMKLTGGHAEIQRCIAREERNATARAEAAPRKWRSASASASRSGSSRHGGTATPAGRSRACKS